MPQTSRMDWSKDSRANGMKIHLPVVLLFGQISASLAIIQQPVVNTGLGRIRGERISFEDVEINIFKGIPFAEPPVGSLRFQKPRPVKPWSGIYNATQFSSQCAQWVSPFKSPWASDEVMSEDCLYLNIWSPDSCKKDAAAKVPVMLWIFPGGFASGSGSIPFYDGTALAALGCVVVVTFNYRLSAFGFMYFGTEDAPGNQGMWDQQMAINWVRAHISRFGGDPYRITLFGNSAGSISVGFHVLSPKIQCLIHRAIMHSGSPTIENMIQSPDVIKKHSFLFAKTAGCLKTECNNENAATLRHAVECLRNQTTQQMMQAMNAVIEKNSFQAFWPIYGDDLLPQNSTIPTGIPFLLSNPYNEGPIMLLFCDLRFTPIMIQNQTVTVETAREMWFARSALRSNKNERNVVDFNFKGVTNGDFSRIQTALANLAGHSGMVCPTQMYAEYARFGGNDVYYSIFNHRPSNSVWPPWFGVPHFDDVQFYFGYPLQHPDSYTSEEVKFSRDLIQMSTSFVKTGVPKLPGNAAWPSFSQQRPIYMELKPGNYTTGEGFYREACQLWKKLLAIV